jgi:hypothetical protein
MKSKHCILHSGMKLECTRCGATYQIGLPVPVSIMLAIMDAFGDLHEHEIQPKEDDKLGECGG